MAKRWLVALLPLSLASFACSSSGSTSPTNTDTGGGGSTSIAGTSSGAVGGASLGGTTASGGVSGSTVIAGGGSSGASAGAGGASMGGTGTAGGSAAGTGGADTGADQMPWRPLNVTAAPKQYTHDLSTEGAQYFKDVAGVDTRAAKMAGKLVVNLGVNQGGYSSTFGKRGFHVFGAFSGDCPHIDDWNLGRDYDGNCRLNTLDGLPHGDQSGTSVQNSIVTQLTAGLKLLDQKYPTEDWGYFLNQDGTVRWSDVAFTGYSHGASSAAVFAHQVRAYRAVSQSGPRDNTCGTGQATGDFDPAKLPYDTACADKEIASWLDSPSATPIDRYFGFVGKQDGQYGDDMFAMERQKYVGTPVNISTGSAPYGGTHRFYAEVGHVGFESFTDAINIAFGVLPENLKPAF